MTPASSPLALLRLLQLSSPTLPVGAFAYSQGLEAAIDAGVVHDESSAEAWILGLLTESLAHQDLPLFARIHRAGLAGDVAAVGRWNDFLFATRASAELQMEDRHLGAAMARILFTLGVPDPFAAPAARGAAADDGHTPPRGPATPPLTGPPTFAALFALATVHGGVDLQSALVAFAFAWCESQTSAAVRLVPLGQSAGVRLLARAAEAVAAAVRCALAVPDDELGAAAPGQALLSTHHETQYSRLFRS